MSPSSLGWWNRFTYCCWRMWIARALIALVQRHVYNTSHTKAYPCSLLSRGKKRTGSFLHEPPLFCNNQLHVIKLIQDYLSGYRHFAARTWWMHRRSGTKEDSGVFFTDAAVWLNPSYLRAAALEMRAIDARVRSTERSSRPAKSAQILSHWNWVSSDNNNKKNRLYFLPKCWWQRICFVFVMHIYHKPKKSPDPFPSSSLLASSLAPAQFVFATLSFIILSQGLTDAITFPPWSCQVGAWKVLVTNRCVNLWNTKGPGAFFLNKQGCLAGS